LNEIVGFTGAYETLLDLEASPATDFAFEEIVRIMKEYGVDMPQAAIEDFLASNLLRRYGDSICLTTLGIRTSLLLEAINGGDLKDVYRRLGHLDSTLRTYELIREGMTRAFLRNLVERPGFGRLYFCSPWISLDRKQEEMLTHAVVRMEQRRGARPEILVITRPVQGADLTVPESVSPLQSLGAMVYLHKQLHTKLYIREPDSSGGYAMAIVGSQNLTKSRYIELGIRINSDSQMITQLITYFLELTHHCHEVL
jgi:hypothetical protein